MVNRTKSATLRLRVWIEQKEETYIGIGSTLLLQHIEKLGSLRKAAEELGMSYRRAWGKLKKRKIASASPWWKRSRARDNDSASRPRERMSWRNFSNST